MTPVASKFARKNRKRWVPWLAAGFFGLHFGLFLLLGQCSTLAPGYEGKVTYIGLPSKPSDEEVVFEFEEPPAKLFPQYIVSQTTEEELIPIAEEKWNGWETLVALKVAETSPVENFRLTLEKQVPTYPQIPATASIPNFPMVVVSGRPFQQVAQVPEPGVLGLSFLSLSLCFLRKRHS